MPTKNINSKTYVIILRVENLKKNWKICILNRRTYVSAVALPVPMWIHVKHDNPGDISKVTRAPYAIMRALNVIVLVIRIAVLEIMDTICNNNPNLQYVTQAEHSGRQQTR